MRRLPDGHGPALLAMRRPRLPQLRLSERVRGGDRAGSRSLSRRSSASPEQAPRCGDGQRSRIIPRIPMTQKILVIVGDGGESYETWFAVHRFQEAGYETRVAAPTKKRLNLVMHDFEPGWDTYMERPGYAMESDLTFEDVQVADYVAVLCIGGRSPEYLRNNARVLDILREFERSGKFVFAI